MARVHWATRAKFLLTSSGAVIGVGNIWRFPFLCFKFGSVFLIPYLLCMVLIGSPILLLELGLGRHFKRGEIDAMGGIHHRLRGAGLAAVFAGFVGLAGYTVILAWSLIFFVASLKTPLPWSLYSQQAQDPASHYFYDVVAQRAGAEDLSDASARSMSGYVYAALLATWVCVFFSTWKGVRGTSWVAQITMPAPVILLLAMVCYTATLPGAREGVKAYIGNFDLATLKQPAIWTSAAGQVFFSVGVSTGTMTALGSYLTRSSNIVVDHLCLCAVDVGVSILAGFSVYTSLGNLAYERGTDMQAEGDSAGFGLAFITYPKVLENLPKHTGNFMGLLFFGALFLLGIDSAFALVEGVATAVQDTHRFKRHPRPHICCVICALGLLLSTMFASSLGPYLLDCIDHYINVYGLLYITTWKCASVGWVWGWEDSARAIGYSSTAIWTIGYIVALVALLGASTGFSQVQTLLDGGMHMAISIPMGILLLAAAFVAAVMWRHDGKISGKLEAKAVEGLLLSGPNKLRESINACAKEHGATQLCRAWDVVVKYVLCALLPALLISSMLDDVLSWERGYKDYPVWLQLVGLSFLGSIILISVVLGLKPSWWDHLNGHAPAVPPVSSSDTLCKPSLNKSSSKSAEGIELQASGLPNGNPRGYSMCRHSSAQSIVDMDACSNTSNASSSDMGGFPSTSDLGELHTTTPFGTPPPTEANMATAVAPANATPTTSTVASSGHPAASFGNAAAATPGSAVSADGSIDGSLAMRRSTVATPGHPAASFGNAAATPGGAVSGGAAASGGKSGSVGVAHARGPPLTAPTAAPAPHAALWV